MIVEATEKIDNGRNRHCQDADLFAVAVFWNVEIANVHDIK